MQNERLAAAAAAFTATASSVFLLSLAMPLYALAAWLA